MLKRARSWSFLFFIIIFQILCECESQEDTLQQIHVLFRHGDRTPDTASQYPKDPYLNDTWFPFGKGALTNLGKQQVLDIGKSLRTNYGLFLGEIYSPDILEARSTSIPRAKLSMELVLAGLWPPHPSQLFDEGLPWQPIEFTYKPFDEDELLGMPLLRKCRDYMRQYVKVISSDEVERYLRQNEDKIRYTNANTGLKITTVLQLFSLYFGLYAEEHTNRTLPKWTNKVYPEFLESAAKYEYELQTATNDMLKYAGGPLLQKIVYDAKAKRVRKLNPPGRKIFLYSGHEFNIAYLLRALRAFKPHIPHYASYLLFELHRIDCEYGFKIYYRNDVREKPELLKIPGCEEKFCPLDKFEAYVRDVFPYPHMRC